MKSYLKIVEEILARGEDREGRNGMTKVISGAMFKHDMANGFPLITTRKMSLKNSALELEFFIQGHQYVTWLQERGNHFWDKFASPTGDLGPIYGKQWRNFGGVDQLMNVVQTLRTNPQDRRMIVTAWNPNELSKMALPPCHFAWQVTVVNGRLNLFWDQRSVDTMIGLPYDISLYGLLLLLLAKEANLKPGFLVGMLHDVHIYQQHLDTAAQQIYREPKLLPQVNIVNFSSIFNWEHTEQILTNYSHHPGMIYELIP